MKKKNWLVIIYLIMFLNAKAAQEKIRLYAFYTPSHKEMLDNWFLPSIQDDYELIIECYDQECESGNFMGKGWLNTMVHKVDVVIRGIKENMGGYFIHSDVDIQFFGPTQSTIEAVIKNKDLVIQRDNPGGTACAGFFVCRANEKTLKLWQAVRKRVLSQSKKNDQDILNELIRNKSFGIKWGYLPTNFFGGGTFSGVLWKPGKDLKIPNNPLMHHANYTVGTENKEAQLEYVKSIVNGRK